jgi:hypothetical protein
MPKTGARAKAKSVAKAGAAALLLLLMLPVAGHADNAAPAAVAAPAARPVDTPVPGAYTGMDEKVNEAMAASGGAPAHAPYLDTEKMGDLWNLILLMGGAIAGFIVGRNWGQLFGPSTAAAPAAKPKRKKRG